MVEVLGKPFLAYQIEQLRDQGFKKILLLLGYLPEVVQRYCGDVAAGASRSNMRSPRRKTKRRGGLSWQSR